MGLPNAVYYYGAEAPLPRRVELRAGPLSMISEQGDLRYVKLGEWEVLRRVYFALRDRSWGTVPAQLSNFQCDCDDDSFRISYRAEHKHNDIDFVWLGAIRGDPGGTIVFSMQGECRSTFPRNRVGLCVLHPIRECAGKPCRLERTDGSIVETSFPRLISPHQVFLDVRAISQEIRPGVWAEVRFQGEVFETEDQRNWTDASYKTYSTPLHHPYPVETKVGTRITQSVSLSLRGLIQQGPAEAPKKVVSYMRKPGPETCVPVIGLAMASHEHPLTSREAERIRALRLAHLRVDLDLNEPTYEVRLARATTEVRELDIPLEMALNVTDDAERELLRLREVVDHLKPSIRSWLVFHAREGSTREKWIPLARQYLAGYDSRAMIGAGTNCFFAELNRDRSLVQQADLVCYPVNPQVHAVDIVTMTENLEGQAFTVETARQFAGALPIAVTPVTLKPRSNRITASELTSLSTDELPGDVDARQMSLFGAGWTLGSLKYLGEAGANSITYYETTGWRGVMETELGSPLPEIFRSAPGCVFPLYHVLADVGEFAGGSIIPSTPDAPLKITGLVLRKKSQERLLLANLTPETQLVEVVDEGFEGGRVRVTFLDETCVQAAMSSPESFRAAAGDLVPVRGGLLTVELRPFALARIDSIRPGGSAA